MAVDSSLAGWLFKRGAVRSGFRKRWVVVRAGRLSWHASPRERGTAGPSAAAAPSPQGRAEPGDIQPPQQGVDAAPLDRAEQGLVRRPRGGGGSLLLRGAVVQAVPSGGGDGGSARYRLTITPSAQSMHRGRVFVFEATAEVRVSVRVRVS